MREKLFLSYIAVSFAERHKRPTILILIFFATNDPLDCILYGCVKIHVLCTKLRTKNKQINK
jgi:hypothetical protein